MNNTSDNWPYHFVITYSDDQIRTIRSAAARHAFGVGYTSDAFELRLAWKVLDAVDDLGRMELFRYSRGHAAIPSRVFADDAARTNFVATARERIEAAAAQAS